MHIMTAAAIWFGMWMQPPAKTPEELAAMAEKTNRERGQANLDRQAAAALAKAK